MDFVKSISYSCGNTNPEEGHHLQEGFQDFGSKVESVRNFLSQAAHELNHADIEKQLTEDDIYTKELGSILDLSNILVDY